MAIHDTPGQPSAADEGEWTEMQRSMGASMYEPGERAFVERYAARAFREREILLGAFDVATYVSGPETARQNIWHFSQKLRERLGLTLSNAGEDYVLRSVKTDALAESTDPMILSMRNGPSFLPPPIARTVRTLMRLSREHPDGLGKEKLANEADVTQLHFATLLSNVVPRLTREAGWHVRKKDDLIRLVPPGEWAEERRSTLAVAAENMDDARHGIAARLLEDGSDWERESEAEAVRCIEAQAGWEAQSREQRRALRYLCARLDSYVSEREAAKELAASDAARLQNLLLETQPLLRGTSWGIGRGEHGEYLLRHPALIEDCSAYEAVCRSIGRARLAEAVPGGRLHTYARLAVSHAYRTRQYAIPRELLQWADIHRGWKDVVNDTLNGSFGHGDRKEAWTLGPRENNAHFLQRPRGWAWDAAIPLRFPMLMTRLEEKAAGGKLADAELMDLAVELHRDPTAARLRRENRELYDKLFERGLAEDVRVKPNARVRDGQEEHGTWVFAPGKAPTIDRTPLGNPFPPARSPKLEPKPAELPPLPIPQETYEERLMSDPELRSKTEERVVGWVDEMIAQEAKPLEGNPWDKRVAKLKDAGFRQRCLKGATLAALVALGKNKEPKEAVEAFMRAALKAKR